MIQWIFLISPYIQDNTLSALPKLVSIAYPTMDTLLLAGALLLAVDNGKRQPAFYMLTGSILCLLFTDFVYGLAILDGTYAGQVWLDWGWIGYYLLWGAAALHPSMRTLEESAPEKESRLSSTRLIVLTAASLIAPIAETVLQARTADIDSFVMIGASAALFLLVVARMAGMVRQEERSVQRERALREAGLALVAAAGRDEIGTATLQAAQQLTGPAYEARLFSSSDDAARAIAGEPETRYSEELPLMVRGEARGELVVDGPVPLTASQRSALESLATSVSLALESAALTEDLHRRESEARFSSLVARSSDLITVVSADGTVLYQSPSIERVLGYRADDVIGSRFDELLPDRERGALLDRAVARRRRRTVRARGDRVLAAAPRRPVAAVRGAPYQPARRRARARHRAQQPRRFRAPRVRGAACAPGVPRLADQARRTAPCSPTASSTGWPAPAPTATGWPWCSSTWTTSRRSTTASATAPATRC